MSNMPAIGFKEFKKLLCKAGFNEVRQKGSHAIFSDNGDHTVCVPDHSAKKFQSGLLANMFEQAGLKEVYTKLKNGYGLKNVLKHMSPS